jgi:hypothetical protein
MVVKGRNRDTAWFSITNDEWTDLENVFTEWLESAVQNRHQRLSKMVNELKARKWKEIE